MSWDGEESGTQADARRLRVFESDGRIVVPRQLAGYVRDLIWRDIAEMRRRRMGAIRNDLLTLLDDLDAAASVNRSADMPRGRILSADTAIQRQGVLPVSRVAERLDLSTRAVTNMLTSGRLRGTKLDGRHWVVSEEDLDNYINGKAA